MTLSVSISEKTLKDKVTETPVAVGRFVTVICVTHQVRGTKQRNIIQKKKEAVRAERVKSYQ